MNCKAIIDRFASEERATLGTLTFQNVEHPTIYTLEPPWKDNKIDVSCIPEGNYRCVPYSSGKYPDLYEVKHVPGGRTLVLLHWGNYPHNTDGCILPGKSVISSKPMVTYSKATIELIKRITDYKEFDLTIRSS